MSSSLGIMKFPTEWKVIKFMFQTTNQMKTLQSEKASMADWNRWRVWNWYVLFIYIYINNYIYIYMWNIADRIERDLLSNKTLLHYRDLEQICLNKTCKMKHFMEERERERKKNWETLLHRSLSHGFLLGFWDGLSSQVAATFLSSPSTIIMPGQPTCDVGMFLHWRMRLTIQQLDVIPLDV